MKIAIMQPYFLPYIGYFQLLKAVDLFVVYDNIEYTKKGWINRNRFLQQGKDAYFTIPLQKDADHLHVVQRKVATGFNPDKLLNPIKNAYKKAPFFVEGYGVIQEAVKWEERNLFEFIHRSIGLAANRLRIDTPVVVSSSLPIDHSLRAQEKVLAICDHLRASIYYNPIGGMDLYSKEQFSRQGVALSFLRSRSIEYAQFCTPFVPWLSIVDVMMFNDPARISKMLEHYEVV
ncbi:WbqC family protein [Paenibacillus sp. MMS18-CY102]|uniref:WbqC family protein n=1 Tax=Paenibacillus sp. MMS18-CY102 TaxID=2682849 RepID=UPI0013655FEB|nr:WbqC family protein [Paenibacillus sp. MMS18-CY102]MWC30898.1 hypothetical protein [Paenibacillus sp. MMS18-CY102]